MGVHDMEICSNGHPPIVHTEGYKNCPLCKAKEEYESESRITGLETEIDNLKDDLVDTENELEEAYSNIVSLKRKLKEHGIEE